MASTSKFHYNSVDAASSPDTEVPEFSSDETAWKPEPTWKPEAKWDPEFDEALLHDFVESVEVPNSSSKGFKTYAQDFVYLVWPVVQYAAGFGKILAFYGAAAFCALCVPYVAAAFSVMASVIGSLLLIVIAARGFRGMLAYAGVGASAYENELSLWEVFMKQARYIAIFCSITGFLSIVAFCVYLAVCGIAIVTGSPAPNFGTPGFWATCGNIAFFSVAVFCTATSPAPTETKAEGDENQTDNVEEANNTTAGNVKADDIV